jgi:hypothetical protein
MNREEALAAFAAYISGEEWPEDIPPPSGDEIIYLPPSLLEQILAADIPADVLVSVGTHHGRAIEVFWEGKFVRYDDGSFRSIISHEFSPRYWLGAISPQFYLDLLQKCVQSRMGAIEGLVIDNFDDSNEVLVRLEYSFPVEGANLGDMFNLATRIQEDLEHPADQVLDDVTRALARSADRILRGHYARASELVARVDAATSSVDKGASLELLMEALFAQVPGFVIYERNRRTATEELDLVVLNDSPDPVYSRDGPIILVECKNWTARPGRPDFTLLENKIRNRYSRCTIAFLVSWSGFAETTWRETIRLSRENYIIVCLAGSDVRQAALTDSFPEFLRQATLQTLTT